MKSKPLRNQVKMAYEKARLRQSLILLVWTVPLTVFSIWACGNTSSSLCLGTILSFTSVIFLWRGQALGKAALTGLFLGSIAFVLPLSFHLSGLCCSLDLENETCFITGAIVGTLLARFISHVNEQRLSYTLASFSVIATAGILACSSMGLGATLGMVLGIICPLLLAFPFLTRLTKKVS